MFYFLPDPPKKTAVSFSDDSVMAMGNTVTLACSSDANPPVEIYTWFKVGESTPVGSGQQYSITDISSEDGGEYYCEARNKYGAEDSTAVSIMEGINACLTLSAYDNNCLRSLYLRYFSSPSSCQMNLYQERRLLY